MLGAKAGQIFDLGDISTLGGGLFGADGTTILLADSFDCGLVTGQCAVDPIGTSDQSQVFYLAGGSGGGGGSAGGIEFIPEPGTAGLLSFALIVMFIAWTRPRRPLIQGD